MHICPNVGLTLNPNACKFLAKRKSGNLLYVFCENQALNVRNHAADLTALSTISSLINRDMLKLWWGV